MRAAEGGFPTLSNRATVLLVLLLASAPLLSFPAPLAGAAPGDVIVETPQYVVTEIPGERIPLGPGAIDVTLGDDEVSGAIFMGFTTRFFGQPTDLFWVGSNGFVTLHFLTPHGCCDGLQMPTPGAGPDGMIAGFWTDLNPALGGRIRFQNLELDNQSALVVDYDAVPVVGGGATATFQVVVFQNGTLEIRIENATSPAGRQFSVGAENVNGTLGVTVARGNGTLADVGARFTPIRAPTQPPALSFVSPNSGSPGSVARLFGAHFEPDATVELGGRAVPSRVESDTLALFLVPDGMPQGVFNVTLRNPDGNASTLVHAFEVVFTLRLDGVSPGVVRQGEAVTVQGTGFTSGATVLVGGRPIETAFFGSSMLGVRIPATFPPGLHDVTVHDPAMGLATLEDVLLVLGRPDLVLASLRSERPAIGLAGGPALQTPMPWITDVRVENRGDLTATRLNLTVMAFPRAGLLSFGLGEPSHVQSFERRSLPVGGAWEVSFRWGNGFEVGDYDVVAFVRDAGVADRDLENNHARMTASAYVTGLGGRGLDPCSLEAACASPAEWRHHREEIRRQDDAHRDASLRVDASMRAPDFSFDRFDMVFTQATDLPGGGFVDCTTWRFLGRPDGVFRVTMRPANGLEGTATLASAGERASNGTVSVQQWSDLRAAGVILHETERQTTQEEASQPLSAYAFDERPSAQWELVATGLTGDFTHCSERTGAGSREQFVYAALPEEVGRPVASFSGAGTARLVEVHFEGRSHEESRQSVVAPPF